MTRQKQIKYVNDHEWWVFWGIIISACPQGKGGHFLFKKSGFRKLTKHINFGHEEGGLNIMSWSRFKDIKSMIHFAFYDRSCPEDSYHPVKKLIDGYNDNRKKKIAAAIITVFDESMCAYQPRTTKTGVWPNLSFIFRKPKPLGCELKVRKKTFIYFNF